MRHIVLLLLFCNYVGCGHPNRNDYTLVFSDEFTQKNGDQPDSTKWVRCERQPWPWNRWVSSSKDVVYIKNGHLVCRAIPNYHQDTDTAKMLTGAIETKGKFSFKYGKVEVRMRTNLINGNFPAVWMKPDDGTDHRYGEIDIVEMFGNQGKSNHTVHTHRSFTLKKEGIRRKFEKKISVRKWHIYGMEWTSDAIQWTIDGKTVGIYKKTKDKQMAADGQWVFDRPFYLRLNQSVGDGSHPLLIPQTDKVYETEFDWIRVYQKK